MLPYFVISQSSFTLWLMMGHRNEIILTCCSRAMNGFVVVVAVELFQNVYPAKKILIGFWVLTSISLVYLLLQVWHLIWKFSLSGDDWEHEETFTDDDEAVDIDPEERADLAPEIPAPPEIKQVEIPNWTLSNTFLFISWNTFTQCCWCYGSCGYFGLVKPDFSLTT